MEQKRKQISYLTAAILAIYVIGSVIGLIQMTGMDRPTAEPVTQEKFTEAAQVQANTEVIGSDIRLLQVIYGLSDTITYRYSVETSCPSWDYEDRYVTTEPLTWVNDTSAVETYASNIAVWYDGTMYASGQHYWVPLLDLSTNDRSLRQMESDLIVQAYQTYVSDVTAPQPLPVSTFLIAIVIMFLGGMLLAYLRNYILRMMQPKEPDVTKEQVDEMRDQVLAELGIPTAPGAPDMPDAGTENAGLEELSEEETAPVEEQAPKTTESEDEKKE